MVLDRYRPAGFFRLSLVLYFAVALVAVALIGWLYQKLAGWLPFVYINLVLCIGFAGVVGAAGAMAIKAGHCRNPLVAALLALPFTAAALASTYYWDFRSMHARHPEVVTLRDYVAAKERIGWKVRSSTEKGRLVLLVVWGGEAAAVFGFGVWYTILAAREPYCERCNVWCSDYHYPLPGVGREAAAPLVARADVAGIVALSSPPQPDARLCLQMEVAVCDLCQEAAYLTVVEKRLKQGRWGKADEKTKTLLKWATLSGTTRRDVLARISNVLPARRAA
jgi:hypothetical protein